MEFLPGCTTKSSASSQFAKSILVFNYTDFERSCCASDSASAIKREDVIMGQGQSSRPDRLRELQQSIEDDILEVPRSIRRIKSGPMSIIITRGLFAQVERVKQQQYPVLNWDSSRSVDIHTRSATLHNSRFSLRAHCSLSISDTEACNTPKTKDTGSESNAEPCSPQRNNKRVSFKTHIEERVEASRHGLLLPCKSARTEDEALLGSVQKRASDDSKSVSGVSPRFSENGDIVDVQSFMACVHPSNWLSLGNQ